MKLSSVDKSLQILELLIQNPHGLSLSEISNRLNFPPSTTHHILKTFIPYDYITQNQETKKYALGFKFLEISKKILDNIDIRGIANKYIRKLHEKCKEAVHLAILRSDEVIYIDKIDNPQGLSLATYVGFRTDPHAAAGGKVLLSGLSEREVRNIYDKRPLKTFGKNTITNMAQLLEELENIRKQGYAIDNEEYYEGVRCVAAPIKAGGKIVAAISVTGSIFSITMDRINRELIGLVTETAEEISSELVW